MRRRRAGRPDDEDVYGGDYGLEDVRQAVAELRGAGTEVSAVTVDRSASAYLPHLFGPRGYTVVTSLPELPDRLPELHRRLVLPRG